MEGQQTDDKLKDLGFSETSYLDSTYFELDEDFSFDIKHKLRRSGLLFNRLALLGDAIMAAPATRIIESLIAARQTGTQTLSTASPHSALANAAGDGLVSGAFFRPSWIVETWNTVNPRPPDRYQTGPEAWGTLSRYNLALLAYRMRENAGEIVVALYYCGPIDVESDSQELAARWNSYLFDSSGALSKAEEISLSQACSSLSVRTIQQAKYSMIVGSCPIIKNKNTGPGISGPATWLWLFDTRQLEFLAPDTEDIKTGSSPTP